MKANCFFPADILLPDFGRVDGAKWSCVACDQYTSEPEYWETADRLVGDAPSTLRLVLPEVYLSETAERRPRVLASMEDYLRDVLIAHPDSMILVERVQSDGKIRRGLVGLIDLDAYDYHRGAQSLIRATELTVAERIPARTTIRRDASIELPHVMLLIDDRARTVIEPLAAAKSAYPVAYDHDLMQGGGHITGYFVDKAGQSAAVDALDALITPEAMIARYGKEGLAPLLFAVGDGNHSLAAAKTCYEEVRAVIGDEAAKNHPARYALAEVVNLYDEALEFEPIYRVAFGVDPDHLLAAFDDFIQKQNGTASAQTVEWVSGDRRGTITIPTPVSALTVGTVQDFLDDYLRTAPEGAYIDYIHGKETTVSLASRADTVGFLFDGMAKEELFSTVISDGSLPRKTFSMGHAADKRFYTEARKLR